MGNSPSSSTDEARPNAAAAAFRNFLKPGNALGITKAELDERCRPSGLYPNCQWEDKMIRRLIGDGKLAARLRGTEERNSCSDRECPICFLNYAEINVTKCCQASICTECYLQVKPQKAQPKQTNGKPHNNNCPFCNASRLLVTVAGKLDSCAMEQRFNEEQQLEAARIRARNGLDDGLAQEQPEANPKGLVTPPTTGFGSSLEQNQFVALMRARSSSIASENSANVSANPIQEIAQVAMTPEERHSLEQEMREQHHHPLTMRLEQEEAERRMRNEMEYYQRAHAARRSIRDVRGGGLTSSLLTPPRPQQQHSHQLRIGGSAHLPPAAAAGRGSDWNHVVVSGARNGQSMDELVVLEAAIMLSMEEQARRTGRPMPDAARRVSPLARTSDGPLPRGSPSGQYGRGVPQSLEPRNAGPTAFRGLSEDQQIALAIEASLRESAASTPSASSADRG